MWDNHFDCGIIFFFKKNKENSGNITKEKNSSPTIAKKTKKGEYKKRERRNENVFVEPREG